MHLSDEALSGLGETFHFVFTSLFGAITQIYDNHLKSHPPNQAVPVHRTRPPEPNDGADVALHEANQAYLLVDSDDPHIPTKPARRKAASFPESYTISSTSSLYPAEADPDPQHHPPVKMRLTDSLPNLGYFAAGGLSGITSRTATAPLDRLKVYLIAQTGSATEAVAAAKRGAPLQATKHGMSTMWGAIKEIWADGGIRSLFAGMLAAVRR